MTRHPPASRWVALDGVERLALVRGLGVALAIVLALSVLPSALDGAEAQPAPRKPPRIGWLTSGVVHTNNVEAFREAMAALGYPEIDLVLRAAGGRMERLSTLMSELLALNIEVIVTDGGPAAFAAKRARGVTRSVWRSRVWTPRPAGLASAST